MKNWYVDIGAPVKAGQLLADVDAPDLDQQLLQARADLANAGSGIEAVGRDIEAPADIAGVEFRLVAGN